MEGFGLLLGHLLGDFYTQNDWMAKNKGNPVVWRLRRPSLAIPGNPDPHDLLAFRAALDKRNATIDAYPGSITGHIACTVHCFLYTLAVWACSFWWMPLWGLPVIFLLHWPLDRFKLAGHWMRRVSGQKAFADGPLAPWSIVVVDNTAHLLVLFIIGVIEGWRHGWLHTG